MISIIFFLITTLIQLLLKILFKLRLYIPIAVFLISGHLGADWNIRIYLAIASGLIAAASAVTSKICGLFLGKNTY